MRCARRRCKRSDVVRRRPSIGVRADETRSSASASRALTAVVRLPAKDEDVPDAAQLQKDLDIVLESFAESVAFASHPDRPPKRR